MPAGDAVAVTEQVILEQRAGAQIEIYLWVGEYENFKIIVVPVEGELVYLRPSVLPGQWTRVVADLPKELVGKGVRDVTIRAKGNPAPKLYVSEFSLIAKQ